MARLKLGELLVQAGAIDELQLQSALGEQRKWGSPLGDTLVKMGMIDEKTLARVLGTQLNTPVVDLQSTEVSPQALQFLDHEFCLKHRCMPFGYQEQGSFLDLAMADPTNPEAFDLIRIRTRCNLRLYLAGGMEIENAVRQHYLGQVPATGEAGRPFKASQPWLLTRTDEAVLDEDGNISRMPSRTAQARPTSAPPPGQSETSDIQDQLRQIGTELRQLRLILERDEKVLTKLMTMLIEKGVFSRAELMARLYE